MKELVVFPKILLNYFLFTPLQQEERRKNWIKYKVKKKGKKTPKLKPIFRWLLIFFIDSCPFLEGKPTEEQLYVYIYDIIILILTLVYWRLLITRNNDCILEKKTLKPYSCPSFSLSLNIHIYIYIFIYIIFNIY